MLLPTSRGDVRPGLLYRTRSPLTAPRDPTMFPTMREHVYRRYDDGSAVLIMRVLSEPSPWGFRRIEILAVKYSKDGERTVLHQTTRTIQWGRD